MSGKIANMSVDDFMEKGFFSDGGESDSGASIDEMPAGEEENMEMEASNADDVNMMEEEEEEEEEELTESNKKLKEELGSHTEELEMLKKKDPEFYKFLQENDKQLLDFQDSEDEMDSEGDEDEEMLDAESSSDVSKGEALKDADTDGQKQITKAMIKKWEQALMTKISLPVLREALHAFRAACHVHDNGPDNDSEASKNFNKDNLENLKYTITTGSTFNSVMNFSLRVIPHCFDELLKYDRESEAKTMPNSNAKLWAKYKNLVKSYCGNLLHLVRQTSEPAMQSFLVKHVESSLTYFCGFPKMTKLLLKTLLELWASAEERVRVIAFLTIRKLALWCPYPYLDICLKGCYLTFVRNAKFTTPQSLPVITFMQNCVVELFGMNMNSSYQHGFVYIRQLAIHLRNAITAKTKDGFKQVYNWQFVHCLKLWSRIIGAYYDHSRGQKSDSSLNLLLYPLVQIIVGTINLIPTSRYLPIRFHCVSSLNLLAKETKTYVHSAAFLLELFASPDVIGKPKMSTAKPFNLDVMLKFPKAHIKTKAFQDGVVSKMSGLLLEFLATQACSVGFTELAFPAVVEMKKFVKSCKNPSHRRTVKSVLDKVVKQSDFIIRERSSCQYAPKDERGLEQWSSELERKGKDELSKYLASWKAAEEAKAATDSHEEASDKQAEEAHLDDDSEEEPDYEIEKDIASHGNTDEEYASGDEMEEDDEADEDIVEDFDFSDDE
eukprot:Nk52_evm26s239 gene=Nk52_evmTU26s239